MIEVEEVIRYFDDGYGRMAEVRLPGAKGTVYIPASKVKLIKPLGKEVLDTLGGNKC